ncbi:MAG: hypothetical protein ACSHWW_01080 [Nonlabens sp.]|uniref:hypothetical protein n=1 Tax=Nonlabens sp. TaxID=1888209 RepID=UPI003EF1F7E6
MKHFLILITILTAGLSHAQTLNDYKYVIVDSQYEFQRQANEYRFNEMIVFELGKRGIKGFRNSEVLPADLNIGRCNSLSVRLITSAGFRVKMTLEFVNCEDEVVYTTKEGIGHTKDFEIAYREALRDAMTSMDDVNYSYSAPLVNRPSSKEVPVQVMEPSTIAVGVNITPSAEVVKEEKSDIPEPEIVELVRDQIYTTDSKEYKIHSNDSGFNVYKKNNLIGTLKKSQSGCYLAVTTDFMGIGYEKDDNLVIEYDKNGAQFLVFKKAE